MSREGHRTADSPLSIRSPRLGWRIARAVAGWLLLALGLVGLVVPILQGVLFLALGLSLLGADSPWARRLLDRLRKPGRSARAGADRADSIPGAEKPDEAGPG